MEENERKEKTLLDERINDDDVVVDAIVDDDDDKERGFSLSLFFLLLFLSPPSTTTESVDFFFFFSSPLSLTSSISSWIRFRIQYNITLTPAGTRPESTDHDLRRKHDAVSSGALVAVAAAFTFVLGGGIVAVASSFSSRDAAAADQHQPERSSFAGADSAFSLRRRVFGAEGRHWHGQTRGDDASRFRWSWSRGRGAGGSDGGGSRSTG